LVVVGSLGLFAPWNVAVADDNSSPPWSAPPSTNSAGTSFEVQRQVHELLRQAMLEMEANRFDSARSLARRAAAIGVTVRPSGVRPDQILAEIDRRERDAAAASQPPADHSGRSYKARAIELLDRGLQALDGKRFDEAEQLARQAAQLQVAWDKYDYRPENLLNEIQRERPPAAVRAGTEVRPAGDPALDARLSPVASDVQPVAASPERTSVPASPFSAQAAVATDPPPAEAYKTTEPIQQTVPQRPVTPAYAGAERTSPAEALLEQAKEDLRAGRDELARRRIERALGMIPYTPQSAALPRSGGYTAASSNRPMGLAPSGPAPNGLTPNGFTATGPAYAPASPPQTFFPLHGNQPGTLPASAMATDVALKPMHDPYLGDEPTTTDKSSPAAQTMRERIPVPAYVDPAYLSRRSAPSTDDSPVRPVGYDSASTSSPPSTAYPPRVDTNPATPALSPQIGWLEKNSAPIPGQGPPMAAPFNPVPAASQRPFNPAPISPPVSMDSQWSAGRMTYPSTTDPAIDNSTEQPKPSFFHKIWDAIGGE
jgi:hypothetical protein